MQEKIVETKNCKHCNSAFEITDKDLEFYDKVSPKFGDRKYSIPTPTLCPDCRQQRRLSFRNERNLYKRKCDATGKNIISIYSPDKQIKVYNKDFWWSDNWNPLDYGKNLNFNNGFFIQFKKQIEEVPKMSVLQQGENKNSDFCNAAANNKSCYLLFEADFNENSLYGSRIISSNNCLDNINILSCNNCYENIDCKNCYGCIYIQNCIDCSESMFLKNCIGCRNCFLSVNLVNSQYIFLNKQYTKEKYFEKLKEINLGNSNIIDKLKLNFEKIKSRYCVKYLEGNENENFLGNYIFNTKNIKKCFDVGNVEDLSYCCNLFNAKKCLDVNNYGIDGENYLLYEDEGVGYSVHKVFFSKLIWGNCNNIFYSYECFSSSNLFGCIGLRNKQYCILNKQYTKEQYNELVPKIIEHMQKTGEWGEFFPSSISPFGYNETVAQEYFPLEKEEAIKQGFNWSDYEIPRPNVEKIIPASKLPEDIKEIPDDILNWAIKCEVTGKPFRIIKQELEFYRKHKLPIPRKHPDQRHLERMKLRNPRKLFDRKCDKCGLEMKTTYSSDREEIVYCEKCYEKEVY